jgi:hypothetical protein
MARYGSKSRSTVKSAMHRMKAGKLKSGKGGKGGTVKSRKQAIAIGLNEAREKGAKVPKASRSRRHASTGSSTRKSTTSRRSSSRGTSHSHARSASSRRS